MTTAPEQTIAQHDAERRQSALARAFARHGTVRCAIMATTFRSGSTWIGRMMDRHGLAGMGHERLRRIDADADPDRYFDTMLATHPGPVFATRLMWTQRNRLAHTLGFPRARSAAFAAQFPAPAWMLLRRRDSYAQAISYWRAKMTNRWHVPVDRGEIEPHIPYDFNAIDACVRELVLHDRLWDQFFALAGIAPLLVWYEDFLADRSVVDAWLAGFGLVLHETDSAMKMLRDAHTERYRSRYLDDLFRLTKGLDHAPAAGSA